MKIAVVSSLAQSRRTSAKGSPWKAAVSLGLQHYQHTRGLELEREGKSRPGLVHRADTGGAWNKRTFAPCLSIWSLHRITTTAVAKTIARVRLGAVTIRRKQTSKRSRVRGTGRAARLGGGNASTRRRGQGCRVDWTRLDARRRLDYTLYCNNRCICLVSFVSVLAARTR